MGLKVINDTFLQKKQNFGFSSKGESIFCTELQARLLFVTEPLSIILPVKLVSPCLRGISLFIEEREHNIHSELTLETHRRETLYSPSFRSWRHAAVPEWYPAAPVHPSS